MTGAQYKARYAAYAQAAEERLAQLCDAVFAPGSRIGQAARYSLLGGGKRVRAVLTLAACALAGGAPDAALDYACALEMVHCHSLIHDDLPCMDNDDLRRGRPSCHRQFDEATALLAGDALLAAAFSVAAGADAAPESRAAAAQILAQGTGAMLYGQELDKYYETHTADEGQLLTLHRNKTGALITAAAALGCAAAGCALPQDAVYTALCAYTQAVGLGFQIVDDVLDATASSAQLGKPAGSDATNGKTTFVVLYGVDGARRRAAELTAAAVEALRGFGPDADFLRILAQELLKRKM